VALKKLLEPFFSDHDGAALPIFEDVNWQNLQTTLQMEGAGGSWCLVRPKGVVVAVAVTQELLDGVSRCSREGTDGRHFAWDAASVTNEDVYHREESWGGQGRQQFAIGDWLVGDIDSISYHGTGQLVWKETATGSITRTLQPSVFQRTYRDAASKAPALSRGHACSITGMESVDPQLLLMDVVAEEEVSSSPPSEPSEHKKQKLSDGSSSKSKARRQLICLVGVDPEHQPGHHVTHSLSSFANETIKYSMKGKKGGITSYTTTPQHPKP